jgi:hypothetical protein
MSDDTGRYEIFIKAVAGFVDSDLTSTVWSWRRLNADGRTIADGGAHPSLEASFASVRRHAALFGAAPVKINLREEDGPASPIVPPVHGARPDPGIIDFDHARRNRLANRALSPAPPRLPVPIAARLPARRFAAQRWVHPASPRQTRRS